MIWHRLSLILVILLFSTSVSIAQVDTSEALSYFPLNVGNKWQFEEIARIDTSVEISYRTVTVLGDTILPNGKAYRKLENDWRYFRVDTSDLKVYLYFPNSYSHMKYSGMAETIKTFQSQAAPITIALIPNHPAKFARCY